MKKLAVVPDLCIGCRECELMCSLTHRGTFNPADARIRIEYDAESNSYNPVVCKHCDVPSCVEICPAGAMLREEQTGAVVIDEVKCTLCLECVSECPHGAINVAPDGTVLKCDLCRGEPVCVRFCSKRPEMSSPLMANPEAATALVFVEEG